MHPLVTILRWWLIQAAAILLTLWVPEAALALFAGNCFGWWVGDGCCQTTSTPCSVCDSGTQGTTNIQVDLASVANQLCSDCNNLNSTFFLDFTSGCRYGSSPSITLCGSAVTPDMAFAWDSNNAQDALGLFSINDHGGASAEADWEYALSSPRDCQSTTNLSTLACTNNCNGSLRCSYTSATVTITPTP